MRVLVAGGAGFLGQSVIRSCTGAQHEVVGLVRHPHQLEAVARVGGIPLLGDLLLPRTLEKAVVGCDVVVHLAQPSSGELAEMRRVRVEGGRALADAAREAGVPRFVLGSGYWVYRSNPGVITEESPLRPLSLSMVNFEAEELMRARSRSGDFELVVLRPGMVYGAGSWLRSTVEEIRGGAYSYVGDGSNYLSPVALDDTGEAYRIVMENWHPGETYLVADDTPITTRAFAEFVTDYLHAGPPSRLTPDEARVQWGADAAELSSASRRVSNAKLRSLGWIPRYRNCRAGLPPILDTLALG
ncbi:MAG: NAD-dependent epimerase/dehydratase family protein [Thermoplasmata archaeon]